jgi:hypothetical protein
MRPLEAELSSPDSIQLVEKLVFPLLLEYATAEKVSE